MYKIITATAVIGMLAAAAAQGGTATTTFAVTATVLSSCTVSATALAFPTYSPGSGATLAGTSQITVKCTNGTGYTLKLNAGGTTGSTFAQRLMANGTNYLQYNLYTATSGGTILGDGTAGTTAPTGTGTGTANALVTNVFGQLPDSANNQAQPPGNYADTISVTVAY